MKVAAKPDVMPREVQIQCVVSEAMENVMRAIFGENLRTTTEYTLLVDEEPGVTLAKATTTSAGQSSVKAELIIRHPNSENFLYHISAERFGVVANDWAKGFTHEAWCEHKPYNGAMAIVRQVRTQDNFERWLVANSMEGEVLYRGEWSSLFPWAKKVVAQKWPHLPHVCIDTEREAMLVLASRHASRGLSEST